MNPEIQPTSPLNLAVVAVATPAAGLVKMKVPVCLAVGSWGLRSLDVTKGSWKKKIKKIEFLGDRSRAKLSRGKGLVAGFEDFQNNERGIFFA